MPTSDLPSFQSSSLPASQTSTLPPFQSSTLPPPLLSVIIAFPAPSAYLDEALGGLARQTERRFEVILLPDAPSGRSWPAWCREIPTGRIRPAAKRNCGIAHARGEFLAFLDDDAWPVDDWLARALPHFAQADVAGVGGPGVTPPNDPYLAQLSGRVYENFLASGHYRYRYRPGPAQDVDDYPSCNFFVRAAAAKAVGCFRTDFWPGEDTYLCLDLTHKLGKRLVYEPAAIVYHHRRQLFLPHLRQIGRYGLHRGYFARRFPATSRRLGYLMPSLLVLGLAGGALLAALWPIWRLPYFAGLGLYLLAGLVASASPRVDHWLLTWLGVIATHLVYGMRFLQGLASPRLPGEVQRFDHPSETPPP